MNIQPIKTQRVQAGDSLHKTITTALKHLPEDSLLVVSSKIVSLCEGNTRPIHTNTQPERNRLVRQTADYYLPPSTSQYRIMLTRMRNWLTIDAGIDVSNTGGHYALWPQDPQASANSLWQQLRRHYQVNHLGIIIADSNCVPLNWSVIGIPIAHCGFLALKNYQGKKDLFGWTMHLPVVNVSHGLAAAAVLAMGEGNEQTPLALITGYDNISFQNRPPTQSELNALSIDIKDDIFAPLITGVKWKKGKHENS